MGRIRISGAGAIAVTIILVLSLLFSVLLMRFLIIRMPTDYFLYKHPAIRRGMIARNVLFILKNLLGLLVLVLGVVMIVTPGPGLVVMLYGLTLLNFPGKQAIELRIVRTPAVLKAIGAIRARAGRPALELPPAKRDGGASAPPPAHR